MPKSPAPERSEPLWRTLLAGLILAALGGGAVVSFVDRQPVGPILGVVAAVWIFAVWLLAVRRALAGHVELMVLILGLGIIGIGLSWVGDPGDDGYWRFKGRLSVVMGAVAVVASVGIKLSKLITKSRKEPS